MAGRDRKQRGPRSAGRDFHYDLCDGPNCPCFQEGEAVGAAIENSVADLFAKTANVHTTACSKCGGSGTQEV